MQLASWKDRKALAQALKPIYQADNAEAAAQALDAFESGPWGRRFPTVAQSWRRQWDRVVPFFAFPAAVRKILYTTNAIESLHSGVRKSIRNKGHFPQRRSRHEADLAGLAPHHGKMKGSAHRLGGSQGAIRDSVRG